MIRTRRATYAATALTAALTLGLGGCGGDGDAADPDPTPTTSTPTTTSPPATQPPTPEEKALAQLEAYLDVRDDALRAAKINFKRLNKVATGKEFLSIQQNVTATAQSGGKVTGEYIHTLGEPLDRGGYILITDCEDRSGIVRTGKDGKPVPDDVGPDGKTVPNPLPIDYTLVKEKGLWLVSEKNGRLEESC